MGRRRRKRKCKGVCYGKGGQEEELQGVIYCLRTEWKSKQRPEMEERGKVIARKREYRGKNVMEKEIILHVYFLDVLSIGIESKDEHVTLWEQGEMRRTFTNRCIGK